MTNMFKTVFNLVFNRIPKNFDQCNEHLLNLCNNEILEKIKSNQIDPVEFHDSLGRWIRNNWGLWTGKSKLYKYLESLGLYHPDDMSNLIIEMFFAHIRNEPYDIEAYVERCNTYWLQYKCEE